MGFMEQRRLGRLGHRSSVLIYGAAALAAVTQEVADESVARALEAGINHFDVAASYGDAELRLGPLMASMRDDIFLASKTGDRGAEEAWASINRSLEKLGTDHLDLIQAHGVNTLEDLDAVTRQGGALEALVRAREEGLVRGIGITGHGHLAPTVHLEALQRFDFDTVLTPLNRRLWHEPGFTDAFTALATEAQVKDVGLMTIKAVARRNWPGERRLSTWYEPFTDQETITRALRWVLDGHPYITGIATPGEVGLLDLLVRAEQDRHDVNVAEAAAELDALGDEYQSVFDEKMPL